MHLLEFLHFKNIMIEYYKNLSLENLFYIDENGVVQEEEWRDVIDYEGLYQISNLGRVKSIERLKQNNSKLQIVSGCIKTQFLTRKKYCYSVLYKDNKKKMKTIHRMVGIAFIPNHKNLPEVNHKDFNKLNNTLTNLEWSTGEDNRRHRSLNEKSTSKYVGVHFDRFRNKWASSITLNKKQVKFGRFDTELEAYMARYNYEIENGIRNTYRQEP